MITLPLLTVTPHNSGYVPQDILFAMLGEQCRDPTARQRHLDYLFDQGDPFTDVIFHQPNACHLYASVSRFVVDLNRGRHEGGANGVVKLTDFDAAPLYPPDVRLSATDIEERLMHFWDPFDRAAEHLITRQGVELVIVGHAMSARGPAIGPDKGKLRPALCLMTGGDTSGEATSGASLTVAPAAAQKLRAAAERHFKPLIAASPEVPPEVVLNDPWSDDEISVRYSASGRDPRVAAFGFEINRDLYLNDAGTTAEPLPGRLAALQAAFATFACEALELVRAHPLGAI